MLCENEILKNLTESTEKQLRQSLFLVKMHAEALLEIVIWPNISDSVFLFIFYYVLGNFKLPLSKKIDYYTNVWEFSRKIHEIS